MTVSSPVKHKAPVNLSRDDMRLIYVSLVTLKEALPNHQQRSAVESVIVKIESALRTFNPLKDADG